MKNISNNDNYLKNHIIQRIDDFRVGEFFPDILFESVFLFNIYSYIHVQNLMYMLAQESSFKHSYITKYILLMLIKLCMIIVMGL